MEEEIEILEERVTTLKRHIKNYEESNCKTNVYQQLVKECKALENLLKAYKELKEKNKHLSSVSDYETICMQCNHLEEQLDIANDKVKQLEKENQSYRDYFGNPPCYDDAKYIPVSKIKENIEEYNKIEKEMYKNKINSNDINEIYKYAVEEDKAKYGVISLKKLLGEG